MYYTVLCMMPNSRLTGVITGSPAKDPDGNEMPDEFSEMSLVTQYLSRTWKEVKLYNKVCSAGSPLAKYYILPSDCVLLCIHFHAAMNFVQHIAL